MFSWCIKATFLFLFSVCVLNFSPFFFHPDVQGWESINNIARKEIVTNYSLAINLSNHMIFQLSAMNFLLITILAKLGCRFLHVNSSLNLLKPTSSTKKLIDDLYVLISFSVLLFILTKMSSPLILLFSSIPLLFFI